MNKMPDTLPLFDVPDDADLADAATLRAAAEIMRRRFGGLGTTIAVLEQKAAALAAVPEAAEVAEPARPRALWVTLCGNGSCTMTVPHTHGVRD